MNGVFVALFRTAVDCHDAGDDGDLSRGFAVVAGRGVVKGLPANFQWFRLGQVGGQAVIVCIAVATFLLFAWGLRYLKAGRAVYATGSDPEAAFLVGSAAAAGNIFGVYHYGHTDGIGGAVGSGAIAASRSNSRQRIGTGSDCGGSGRRRGHFRRTRHAIGSAVGRRAVGDD